jgi:cytosine/adenosine deaminase-related metal-dependent hydrolase
MQREGIVAVGDISNKEDSFKVKSGSKIHYHTFVEIFNLENALAKQTFDSGKQLMQIAWDKYKLSTSLVPHASYSVSEQLFSLFREEMNAKENLLSIHNLETEHENPFISDRKGKLLEVFEKIGLEKGDSKPRNMSSMPWLSGAIPPASPLLLVHNVYLTAKDIENSDIDREKTWYCLCPNSNLYIGNVLPGSFLMKNFPDKVCIGTDSLSSNHRLSIIAELITLNENYPEIDLEKLLKFATLNGAEMLGIDDWAGSFEPGKRPGVNLIGKVDLEGMRVGKGSYVKKII